MKFRIRQAAASDLSHIMNIEMDWPEEQRCTLEKFVSRMDIFPKGFFVVEMDSEVVAVSTSTLVHYNSESIEAFSSWALCTNDGFLQPLGNFDDYNALYIVSNGIMKKARRIGIREEIIKAHLQLARDLGLEYVVTGAMIPGYRSFCQSRGFLPAAEYAILEENGRLIDPTLRKLASLGLELPTKDHIIEDFYPSPESHDFGALLVHEVGR